MSSLNVEELAKELDTERADSGSLYRALAKLVSECAAEFTVDGKWSDTGQLVKKRTFERARAALAAVRSLQAERDEARAIVARTPLPIHNDIAADLDKEVGELRQALLAAESRAASLAEAVERLTTPRPLNEYHEDYGPVLWYAIPIQEPPYVGWPGDEDWPGYHTHWTPLPDCNLINDRARSLISGSNPNE